MFRDTGFSSPTQLLQCYNTWAGLILTLK